MGARRKAECEAGARELGIDLRMLGLADGELSGGRDGDLDVALHAALDDLDPATVAVTWAGDGHPDHHACAESVRRWCRGREVPLLEFPVWMWHWARPEDPDVPWSALRRIPAGPGDLAAKRRALDHHASQLTPQSDDPAATVILPPAVVERFFLDDEWVFVP